MKRQKPGFRVFIKTRLKHPLMSNYKLEYTSESGDRFRDISSVHTNVIIITAIVLFISTVFILSYTLWGYVLCVVILVSHHYLRYFWTNFAKLDEMGKEIDERSLM